MVGKAREQINQQSEVGTVHYAAFRTPGYMQSASRQGTDKASSGLRTQVALAPFGSILLGLWQSLSLVPLSSLYSSGRISCLRSCHKVCAPCVVVLQIFLSCIHLSAVIGLVCRSILDPQPYDRRQCMTIATRSSCWIAGATSLVLLPWRNQSKPLEGAMRPITVNGWLPWNPRTTECHSGGMASDSGC
jgi:hypothetical protein